MSESVNTLDEGDATSGTLSTVTINDTVTLARYADAGDVAPAIALYVYTGDLSKPVREVIEGVAEELAIDALADLAAIVPPAMEVTLTEVLYASLAVSAEETIHLFSFAVGTELNLSALSPVLAQALPDDELLAVNDLRVYLATAPLDVDQVALLNGAIEGMAEAGGPAVGALPDRAMAAGIGFGYTLVVAGEEILFDLPVPEAETETETKEAEVEGEEGEEAEEDSGGGAVTVVTEGSVCTLWYELQKSFGAAEFGRVGLRYDTSDNRLSFLLDAALRSSSMELTLQEVEFGSSLTRFAPEFSLAGIGLAYETPSLGLAGQFAQGANGDYEGGVVVRTKTFNLLALGAFGTVEGHPSLFVYGVLDKPLGGPAFFFVEGLSAGLGYNRALATPAIEEIPDFPLVAAVLEPEQAPEDLAGMASALQEYITPSVGAQFYAFGVKFNTFKIVDSFALLIAIIDGQTWKLRLLGYSALTAPLPKEGESADPLAYLELALDGTLDPTDGSLGIQGQLTDNSFVLSKDCKVTGGFAFYAWFSGEHEGDFVQTIGGYHPDFDVPSHYPVVPRLALDWRIDASISVEGELYFALTPRLLMAGGYLKATWKQGGIEAWFKTRADFLVAWQPYSYSIRMSVDVGASAKIKVDLGFTKVHRKITIHVGARLDLWGPKFAGKARIKASLLSFTIAFGGGKRAPEKLSWGEFRAAFLPDSGAACTVQAVTGVLGSAKDGVTWVMSARDLSLRVDSIIPATAASFVSLDDDDAETVQRWVEGDDVVGTLPAFGLGPMGVSEDVASTIEVRITRGGLALPTGSFTLTPFHKNLPAGPWGTSFSASLKDDRMIEGAFAGFTITPAVTEAVVAGAATVTASVEAVGVNVDAIDAAFDWAEVELRSVDPEAEIPDASGVATAYAAAGAALAAAIFADLDPVDGTAFDPSLYRSPPQVERASSSPQTA